MRVHKSIAFLQVTLCVIVLLEIGSIRIAKIGFMKTGELIFFLCAVTVALPLLAALASWMFTYEFKELGIGLRYWSIFGKIELRYLKFNLIAKVNIVPTWKVMLFVVFPLLSPLLSFGTRWWQKHILIVHMKTGIFRWIILTPEDIDLFVEKIRDKLPQGSCIEDCRSARNTTNA